MADDNNQAAVPEGGAMNAGQPAGGGAGVPVWNQNMALRFGGVMDAARRQAEEGSYISPEAILFGWVMAPLSPEQPSRLKRKPPADGDMNTRQPAGDGEPQIIHVPVIPPLEVALGNMNEKLRVARLAGAHGDDAPGTTITYREFNGKPKAYRGFNEMLAEITEAILAFPGVAEEKDIDFPKQPEKQLKARLRAARKHNPDQGPTISAFLNIVNKFNALCKQHDMKSPQGQRAIVDEFQVFLDHNAQKEHYPPVNQLAEALRFVREWDDISPHSIITSELLSGSERKHSRKRSPAAYVPRIVLGGALAVAGFGMGGTPGNVIRLTEKMAALQPQISDAHKFVNEAKPGAALDELRVLYQDQSNGFSAEKREQIGQYIEAFENYQSLARQSGVSGVLLTMSFFALMFVAGSVLASHRQRNINTAIDNKINGLVTDILDDALPKVGKNQGRGGRA